MKPMDKKLKEFEGRKPKYNITEQKRRSRLMERFSVINRFEGINSGPIEKRLFALLTTGRITPKEYLELCKADAL